MMANLALNIIHIISLQEVTQAYHSMMELKSAKKCNAFFALMTNTIKFSKKKSTENSITPIQNTIKIWCVNKGYNYPHAIRQNAQRGFKETIITFNLIKIIQT